ncbi:MAG: hemolysin family protein [Chloroflexota bacterium]|nr:hemolysin family protein [Chloroflexota bacterium]
MTEYLIPILVIAFLILLNAFFVAAEFAIIAVPRTRIAQAAEKGSKAARDVLRILIDPDEQNRYLATAQIGITIASLGLGMYGEHVLAGWLLEPLSRFENLAEPLAHTIASIVAIGLMTYLHVVLGEMVPKSLAIQYAEATVLRLNGPMRFIRRIFSPLVSFLNAIGNAIVRLMGIPPASEDARLLSAEELEFIAEESAEGGLMDADDLLFIENIFDLRERTVGQVMTPRNHIMGIPASDSEAGVMRFVCEARHSRFPVYEQDLDDVIGIVHIKTLARREVNHVEGEEFDLLQLLRPVIYVPESLPLDDMLARFRRERNQLAIVVDEYGGTAGLVTLEDVIEEVVGEILDEFDLEIAPLEQVEPGLLRARGDLLVDELNQLAGLNVAHPGADTVGGLVMSLLGRVAEAGDIVVQDGVTFEVESVMGLAVQQVLVRLPEDGDPLSIANW